MMPDPMVDLLAFKNVGNHSTDEKQRVHRIWSEKLCVVRRRRDCSLEC